MLFYAWNTTLGDTTGFDSTFYLNLVSTNVDALKLNSTSTDYGVFSSGISAQYTFQSYYYFLSYFIYFVSKFITRVTDATNMSIMVWIFQTIYNFFLVSIVINGAEKIAKNKRLFKYVMLFIFLFFYGKIYFNNIFGFYGNTYKTIAIAYAILYLYELINESSICNWIMFACALLASCAFSSTAVFILFLLLFGAYFGLVDKEDYLFRFYGLILYFPLVNIMIVGLRKGIKDTWYLALIACIIIFILNKFLVKLSRLKYTKLIIVVIAFLTMFIMSYKVTGNLLDFSAFFNNGSEKYDMTINYFALKTSFGRNQNLYRIIIWISLLYMCIFEYKNKLIISFIILIVVLFNPFCCAYLYSINPVYYRAYEIIINPFTFMLYVNMMLERINNKKVNMVVLIVILASFTINTDYLTPLYYHESFVPGDTYNNLMKMDKDEYDVLKALKVDADYYSSEISNPYIITSNLFTESVIPNGSYLFGREFRYFKDWSESRLQLYSMFYPADYLGNKNQPVKPDYDNLAKYLKEEGVTYIVVDKTEEYYDEDLGYYTYLIYKVAECGYGYSVYSNDTYELIKCFE